jgi:limonene-1,2-epoxide hydrolase
MDPASTVTEFIRRVAALELASAGELVADDIEYDNVPVGKNLGREAMITFLSGMNERSDRFRVGDTWIDLPVAGVFEVGEDGCITLWRDYFDLKTFFDQRAAVRPG